MTPEKQPTPQEVIPLKSVKPSGSDVRPIDTGEFRSEVERITKGTQDNPGTSADDREPRRPLDPKQHGSIALEEPITEDEEK